MTGHPHPLAPPDDDITTADSLWLMVGPGHPTILAGTLMKLAILSRAPRAY